MCVLVEMLTAKKPWEHKIYPGAGFQCIMFMVSEKGGVVNHMAHTIDCLLHIRGAANQGYIYKLLHFLITSLPVSIYRLASTRMRTWSVISFPLLRVYPGR